MAGTETETRDGTGARRRRVLVALAASSAALAALAVLTPYVMTANPSLCAACHEMRPYVESWRESTHSAAADDCADCHAAPGLLGGLAYRMGLYGEAAARLSGVVFRPGHAAVPGVSSCRRRGCHSANRVASPSGELRIGHRLHVDEAGLTCVRCHPGAAHRGVTDRALLPPMRMCKGCHAEEMSDCGFCHSRRIRSREASAAAGAH